MLKGDAQYSREEVVEVSSLSHNWCAWVALGLALGLDISSASAFVLLCFSASPRTLGLGHPLGLTLGLGVGLALGWASLDHPHSIALLVRPFITSQWATWSEKHQTLNKWTPSCWPILWCFFSQQQDHKGGWQAHVTLLHADRYMLLEKKILALREELEEREAAMQVPYPLVIHSLINSILPSWLSPFLFIKRRFQKVFQTVPNR